MRSMMIKKIGQSAAILASLLASHAPLRAESLDDFVKVSEDLTIHYRSEGSGDVTIVFVPGWTMSTDVFERQLTHFKDSKDFRAVSYDPRAQGLSSITIEGHYYEQHARDLHAFLSKLEAKRTVLVGWSSGGGDVLEYVRLFGSDNLAGFVLVDTAPKVKTTDNTAEWAWFGTRDEGDQDGFLRFFSYEVMRDRKKINTDFATWMLEDASPANIRFVEKITNRTPDSIAALLNSSYWYLDNTQQVKDLNGKVPLLYVTREEWKGLATKWAEKNTPAAKVVSFGKHMMFWEHADRFNSVLDEYLSSIKR